VGPLVAAVVLTGCGQLGSSRGVDGELEALPGVRAAAVHKQALDTDYYAHNAVVDMEAGATRDQIVAALDALAAWHGEEENEDTVTLYLGGGTVSAEAGTWGDGFHQGAPTRVIATAGSHAENVGYADLLLRATDVLDAPVVVRDYEWTVTAKDPRAVLGMVLRDPELAAVAGLHVMPEVAQGAAYWGAPAEFSSTEPLTRAHVAAYDQATRNGKLVRHGRAHVAFVGSVTGQWPRVTDKHPGAIMVDMTIRLPEMVGPQHLAADPLQDARWPAVAAQLDLLRTLPDGSQVMANLEWGRSPEGGADRFRWLVDIVKGGKVHPKPIWNDEAARYLAG
jgi:hypothetical protein